MVNSDWALIKESEIPSTPKGTTKTMQRSLDIVSALKPGLAAAVSIPAGMTARGQRGSLTKAAKSIGVPIEITEVGDTLYVRLTNG